MSGLLTDLEQRGLLDNTLVVWCAEFCRTPMRDNRSGRPSLFLGRDHHPAGFTSWLAGGGVRPGFSYGATDELGYAPVEKPVGIHDFQATVLSLTGIDHSRLVYPFRGLDQRLTGVQKPVRVVEEIRG